MVDPAKSGKAYANTAKVPPRSYSPRDLSKPSHYSSTSTIQYRNRSNDLPPAISGGDPKRLQKHPAAFQCTLCPKRFTRAYNLRSHLRTHTDERPFVCSVCGKAFAGQHDRKRHEDLHSGEKKYVCEGLLKNGNGWGCGRRFARADALGRHFCSEAGRACIQPLRDEEAAEKGWDVPSVSTAAQPDTQTMQFNFSKNDPEVPSTMNLQHPQYSSSDPFSQHPPPLYSNNSLPPALLQQYPALEHIMEWDAFPAIDDGEWVQDGGSLNYSVYASYGNDMMEVDLGRNDQEMEVSERAGSNIDDIGIRFPAQNQVDHHFPWSHADQIQKMSPFTELKSPKPDCEIAELDLFHKEPATKEDRNIEREPAFSDSGYHTGKGTDTASVCSLESSGSSLGLPQDFLQNFIAVFGDILIEKSGAKAWAAYTTVHSSPEVLEKCLHDLLREYAIGLSGQTASCGLKGFSQGRTLEQNGLNQLSSEIIRGATHLIRRYRPKIAAYFRFNALGTVETGQPILSRLRDLTGQLSPHERFNLLERTTQDADPPDYERDLASEDEDDDIDDQGCILDIDVVQDFLVSGDPFKNLAKAMRRSLYCDDQGTMHSIRETVQDAIHRSTPAQTCSVCCQKQHLHGLTASRRSAAGKSDPFYHALFSIDWDPRGFCRSQYAEDETPLREMVTLSGSALYAYATTCAEYLRFLWPNTHDVLLPQLQIAMDAEESSIVFSDDTFSSVKFQNGCLELHVHGSENLLVELAQQVCWMGESLREGNSGFPTTYCESEVTPHVRSGTEISTFDIHFSTRPLHSTENPCWLSLFDKAMIAYKFPIPERENEIGLEIPIDILAAIVGARHAVEYDGGLVLKGFSSILFPVNRQQDRVQWHLVLGEDPDKRLTYHDALSLGQFNTRALIEEVGLDSLHSTRAIIGWCSATEILLGSEKVNYGNIHYSGAEDASHAFSITGGAVGFQQFGAGQIDFKLGAKEGKFHFQRVGGPYKRIISVAEKTPVALYDTAEKRAWLFPASAVILHIAQTRHYEDPTDDEGELIRLFSKDTSTCSARERLLKDAGNLLSKSDGYRLKNMVLDIWSLLEYLLDQSVKIDTAPGATPKATLRDTLCGFEFKAVVEERSPFRLKSRLIEKTSGGWTNLIKDIDALVLFANGFEDLILPSATTTTSTSSSTLPPAETKPLCRRYRTVPKGKDFLATTVKALTDLYAVAGSPLDRSYLTSSSKLQWHSGSDTPGSLFGPCATPASFRCKCERLSQIVPSTAIGTVVGPGDLDKHATAGAAIFGQSGNLLRSLGRAQQQQGPGHVYSQPNGHIDVGVTVGAAAAIEEEEEDKDEEIKDSDSSDSESSHNSRPSLDSSYTTLTCGYGAGDGNTDRMCVSNERVAAKKRQLAMVACYENDPLVDEAGEMPYGHFLDPALPVKRARYELVVQGPHVAASQGQQNSMLRSRPGKENLAAMADIHRKGMFVPTRVGGGDS